MRKPFNPSNQTNNSNEKIEERILNVWTIDDIEQFKPNHDLYVVGNGHIMKGKDRLHLIVGYAGVGKSRAANYLAGHEEN